MFTDEFRSRLRAVLFRQKIRSEVYGEATATEHRIGHTPTEVRDSVRAAAAAIFDSSDDSDSSSFYHGHRESGRFTSDEVSRGIIEDKRSSSVPKQAEAVRMGMSSHEWLSPPSTSSERSSSNRSLNSGQPSNKRKRGNTPADGHRLRKVAKMAVNDGPSHVRKRRIARLRFNKNA